MSKHHNDTPDCAGRNGAQDHGRHTPGPWRAVADPAVYDSLTDIMDVEGNYIAFTSGTDLPTMEANARLIAAAPELLEALRGFVECDEPSREHYEAAHAAIAKAEGRSDV